LLQFELKHLFEGKDEFEAKRLAENNYNQFDKVCSREDAALIFFENIPHFELFEDFSSLLPNKIDLEDLFHEHTLAEGYKAVKNFLVIAGLEPHFFYQTNNRILKQKIENLNNELTVNFQDYWGQCIGKTNKIQIAFELEHYDFQNPEKRGKPYLEFWIKDEQERLYPKQRSRGVRWFLSFYLELKASASKYGGKNRVLLIDEPGLSLHARAQEDVLKVFDDIRDKLQVVYTTHSPNLIDSKKLFRILAVQRSHDMDNSETVLFDASSLHSAAQDTLFPIYALMGVQLSENHFIRKKNNVIVEDIATFYYLSAMLPMTGYKKEISFIPATGGQSLQLLSNLMLGWGLDYSILVFGNDHVNDQIEELKKNLKPLENPEAYRIVHLNSFSIVEDLFSTLDFKKHIIDQRIGIPESNGEFIHDNNLSRVVLANSLAQKVKSNVLKFSDFDDETKSNFKMLAQRLDGLLP
jgi:ABC-type ATPase involved in cell division